MKCDLAIQFNSKTDTDNHIFNTLFFGVHVGTTLST